MPRSKCRKLKRNYDAPCCSKCHTFTLTSSKSNDDAIIAISSNTRRNLPLAMTLRNKMTMSERITNDRSSSPSNSPEQCCHRNEIAHRMDWFFPQKNALNVAPSRLKGTKKFSDSFNIFPIARRFRFAGFFYRIPFRFVGRHVVVFLRPAKEQNMTSW